MKILITGATGFIGHELAKSCHQKGHHLILLSRDPEKAKVRLQIPGEYLAWQDGNFALDAGLHCDAVIHLAGETVGEGRWTMAKKQQIYDSRVLGTRNFLKSLLRLTTKPKVIVLGSAIGYYGDRGDEELFEHSNNGDGFLATVGQDWEAEAKAYQGVFARVVQVRTGVVLGEMGGALKRMLPAFRLGLGGSLGSGRQWISWIHLEDLIRLFEFCVENQSVRGILNGVAPHPVRQCDFAKTLRLVLKRPALLWVPAFALRLLMGEQADLVLMSQRVVPQKAQEFGFTFCYPQLQTALKDLLT